MLAIGSIMLPSFASHPDGHQDHSAVNVCEGAQPRDGTLTNADGTVAAVMEGYFNNRACEEMIDTGYNAALPQAGMDVTADGDYGDLAYSTLSIMEPIMGDYAKATPPLCPVNVHWHLGTEHRSEGQYDEGGNGPYPNWNEDSHVVHGPGDAANDAGDPAGRRLAGDGSKPRQGGMCYHYAGDGTDAHPGFSEAEKTEYEWKYCKDMHVGNTYEIHWPHSAVGACGKDWYTHQIPGKWQYQYPFYDGVFCGQGPETISIGNGDLAGIATGENTFNVNKRVGVQGQVYTIINSDANEYQHDTLFYGAWMGQNHWSDVATYIGSTTGTSRDNNVCSMYSPITWQVDRTCHVISARSWDHMCKLMLEQADDLEYETHPHGSRKLVNDEFSSDTVYRRE
jgi:hypothetical protein